MRVALLSDIHGNRMALDSALRSMESESVDSIVFLGDSYSAGPWPHETLERLKTVTASCIIGNHDVEESRQAKRTFTDQDITILEEIDEWCTNQLTQSDIDFLRSFKPMITLPLGQERTLLAFHGSPRSNREWIFSNTPDHKLEEAFDGHKAEVMAFGHTHIQMLRKYGNFLLINPGSASLPFEDSASTGGKARIAPRVEYAILDATDSSLEVEFRRIPIDSERMNKAFLTSDMPHANRFFQVWPRRISNLYAKLSNT